MVLRSHTALLPLLFSHSPSPTPPLNIPFSNSPLLTLPPSPISLFSQTGHLLSSLAKAAPSHSVSDLSAALQGTGLGKVLKRYCKDLQQGGGVMGEHTRIARYERERVCLCVLVGVF